MAASKYNDLTRESLENRSLSRGGHFLEGGGGGRETGGGHNHRDINTYIHTYTLFRHGKNISYKIKI